MTCHLSQYHRDLPALEEALRNANWPAAARMKEWLAEDLVLFGMIRQPSFLSSGAFDFHELLCCDPTCCAFRLPLFLKTLEA